jgi:glycerol kinase
VTSSTNELAVVLDVGTTNIRVVVFSSELESVFTKEQAVQTTHKHTDWAEQDPETILATCKSLLAQAEVFIGTKPTNLGITNQRESVVAWDKSNGEALSPLLLWSDKRTEDYCNELKSRGYEDVIRYKTGLALTPYSSAPKIHWLMQQDAIKTCGDLAIGTLDSWLIFKLTGNFLTDHTNASRTMLFNIHTHKWDEELLHMFKVDRDVLAEVQHSRSNFGSYATGSTHMAHAIGAVIGDQQASLYAAGSEPGTAKITYGTGIFPMRLIGDAFQLKDGFLTTLAIGPHGKPAYALEGKIENAAPRVSKVYGIDKSAFDSLMVSLANEAAPVIARLFDPGEVVYVDGGISQNDDILAEQERLNGLKTKRLSTHNGTALGVAKLLFNLKSS